MRVNEIVLDFMNKLKLENARKSMLRNGKTGYMNFGQNNIDLRNLNLKDTALGNNEFINNLTHLQMIRACKKRIKQHLLKLGNSRKHVLNKHVDFKGYVFDRFILPIKNEKPGFEVNVFLVLMNDLAFYKSMKKLSDYNKKSIRKNGKNRGTLKNSDFKNMIYNDNTTLDTESNFIWFDNSGTIKGV